MLRQNVVSVPHQETTALRAAVRQLYAGHSYAADLRESCWEFAIGMPSLTAAGLSENDVRWLLKRGYLEHRVEITPPGKAAREFCAPRASGIQVSSVFALTATGVTFAESLLALETRRRVTLQQVGLDPLVESVRPSDKFSPQRKRPRWDAVSRELLVADQVVKKFNRPAANQHCVLDVFEEDGWPGVIDDPLPPKPGVDQRRRLRDTVYALNQNQVHRLLSFHCDGDGEQIRWSLDVPHA